MNLVMWTRHPRPVRMITASIKTACRRCCYTFVRSNKSQDAIEVLAIIAIVTLLFLAFVCFICRQFVRCVIAHIENWIVKAQNDR